MAERIRKLLSRARALWGGLSTVTRVFLVAYALIVVLHWALRYAPGETLVELEPPVEIEEPIIVLTFLPPTGEQALLAMAGEDDWWLLDWTRAAALERDTNLKALVTRKLSFVEGPHQGNATDERIDLLVWRDAEHLALHFGAGGKHEEPAPPQAQWISPDHTPVVPKPGEARPVPPAWRVGKWAVMRPAVRRWVQVQDGGHEERDVADNTDFLLYDARSGEQRQRIETLAVERVFAAPRWAGLLYASGNWLSYLACDDGACWHGDAELRGGSADLDAADYHPGANRIAVCSGSELFFYSGAPDDEYIVYLGKGALDGRCANVWVASPSVVLLQTTEGSFQVARFRRRRG